jgi:hypothetical protein
MLDKLQAIEDKYLDLEAKISDPDIIADQKEWQKCTKAHAKLTDIVTVFREYRDLVKAKNDAEEIIAAGDDRELTEMAYDELKELKPQLAVYEERLTVLLLPSDPNDDKDVIEEAVPAVMKPLCLQAYFLGCIPVMQKLGAGALKLWIPTRLNWEALRKLFSRSVVTVFMAE